MSSNPRHSPIIEAGTFGKRFTKAGFLHTWEVFPLAFIVSSAMCGTAAFLAWQLNSRDIQVNRRRKPINERVNLLDPRVLKLLVVKEGPLPVPELHAIYSQMDEEKRRRQDELDHLRRQGKRKAKKQD